MVKYAGEERRGRRGEAPVQRRLRLKRRQILIEPIKTLTSCYTQKEGAGVDDSQWLAILLP
jgi:hypothetical protein